MTLKIILLVFGDVYNGQTKPLYQPVGKFTMDFWANKKVRQKWPLLAEVAKTVLFWKYIFLTLVQDFVFRNKHVKYWTSF